jgi:CRISPR/Cas system CSM-associated protein Csm3 (group 7 of RAMP superfamily)
MSKITGAFVISGTVTNISPVMIGTGQGENIDIEIVRGYAGGIPYIPATAFTGALRHRIAGRISSSSALRFFWGGEKDSDSQSHFVIEDLVPEEGSEMCVAVRDGIRIDNKTGLAVHGAKFSSEVLEPGVRFRFHAEAMLRAGFSESLFQVQIARVLYELSGGDGTTGVSMAVGGMVNKGFGRVRLESGFKVWKFDFRQADHARYWLEYRGGQPPPNKLLNTIAPKPGLPDNAFCISADFGLKSSLIIGSYSSNPKMPDKTHLTCKGKQILSGTSIKGALRARAVRIINTFGKDGQEMLKNVFGWAESTRKSGGIKPVKSRLMVEEVEVVNSVPAVQTRVKIDRFTSGTSDSALYDSMPLWETTAGSSVSIRLSLENFQNWEAGLMLHLLKDLWSGDLPIGGEKNVGRGVLKGKKATVHVGGKDYTITAVGEESHFSLSFGNGAREVLDIYADAFLKKMEE